MGYALNLPNALRARGLRVEVVPGWETRSAGSFNPKGAVAHWTAGPRGSTGRPSLNVCTYGRSGLDGPLCNVYGARDGTAIVVAAGRANHAGTGGWRGLVGNSAVFGTEMEGADASDFTPEQRWAYPRIHAAYCDLGGFGPDMNCGHSEWAGPRKQDINGYTPDLLRTDIAAVLAGHPTQEDDVVSEQDKIDIANKVAQLIPGRVWDVTGRDGITLGNLMGMAAMGDKIPGRVWDVTGAEGKRMGELLDVAALGSRVVPAVVSAVVAAVAQLPGVSAEQVQAAAEKGAANALENLHFAVSTTVTADQDRAVDAGPVSSH